MDKQELIEGIKRLKYHNASKKAWVDRELVLDLVKQLDEPQKVKVPQFVANYIKKYKEELSVREAISKSYATFEVDKWLAELDEDGNFINQNSFALAWINGYEVEKEKLYKVKMRGLLKNHSYLNHFIPNDGWLFHNSDQTHSHKVTFTRKELEEAGFGEVFNSPLFEIEVLE